MENQIICPCCQGKNVKKTTKGKVVEGTAGFAAGFAVGAAKVAANNLAFEGAGRLIPGSSAKTLASYASVQHVCNDCYQLLNVRFDSEGNVKSISKDCKYSDEEIKKEQCHKIEEIEALYDKYKKGVTRNVILTIIFVIYTICCYEYPLGVSFGICISLFFIYRAYSKNNAANEKLEEIDEITSMSLNEYRYKFM